MDSLYTHICKGMHRGSLWVTLGQWKFKEFSQCLSRGYPDFPWVGTRILPTVQVLPSHLQHIPRNPTLVGVTLLLL